MRTFRIRLAFVSVLLSLLGGMVLAKLVSIQVIHADEFSQRSRQQSLQRRVVRAPRGRLLDRKGRELAVSVEGGGDDAAAGRLYPHGDLAAPVLGFIGRDGYGLGGAELAFDGMLRGEDGWTIVQRDARATNGRQRKYNVDLPSKPATPGADIYLTIDLDIQTILQNVLKQTLERFDARGVMGMVMDPKTGRILAMASEPSFDPNVVTRYSLAQRANRCISHNYEPGSTFKLVAAAAALEEKRFNEGDVLDANHGVYVVYDQSIRDHQPFTTLTFTQALTHSSNVCFAKVADRLGSETFYRYTRNFGFGQRTGIALPGEEEGIVHPIRAWSGRTRVTMAIGQELTATLLQVMMLFGAVANDGVLLQPRICERVVDTEGEVVDSATSRPVRRVVSSTVAARLRTMLQTVVDSGTGTRAGIDGVAVAGKTGTSQKLDEDKQGYSDSLFYASFVGFAPVDDPALLCGIVVDEPATGKAGGLAAAPAFRQVVTQAISHPDLEYAERILGQRPVGPIEDEERIRVPMLCGLPVLEAERRLREADIGFQVIGDADTVTHQSPLSGARLAAGAFVKLYANDSPIIGADSTVRVAVPECRGKDLRDALSLLNIRGLTPYVKGAGRVVRQFPPVGTVTEETAVCTLECAFET
ncbi:MAG: PASTA domain-containing protein [Chitinivibrionales bacterium]|nr:PASTA domain-containing protein [Chitinivibrionales bacterium]